MIKCILIHYMKLKHIVVLALINMQSNGTIDSNRNNGKEDGNSIKKYHLEYVCV